jgi:hypothetical protein
VDGPALEWELGGDGEGAALSVELDVDPAARWIVRCDRVDFPPGAVAYRHAHPGGGIRRLLFGSIRVEAPGHAAEHAPGGAWFEGADYPVLATASATVPTAFVGVMVLPAEWEGRRTIRYLDPADEAKPRLQRAAIFPRPPARAVTGGVRPWTGPHGARPIGADPGSDPSSEGRRR